MLKNSLNKEFLSFRVFLSDNNPMRRKVTFLTLIATALILVGCGKTGETTKAQVTLVAGGLVTPVPGQTGGVILLGFNPQTGQSFSKTFDGAPMELSNGMWDFAAIAWDGNAVGDVMEGVVRCGIARGVPLNGGEVGVPLSLATSGCYDAMFGADDTKALSGEPLPILPTICTDERGVYDTFEPGTCKNSTTTSYRIIFPVKDLNGTTGAGLVSACVTEDTPTTAELDSASRSIKIPMVIPGAWNLPIVIDLFDGANCTGSVDRVIANNIYSGAANRGAARINEQGSYAGIANELRISKNPCSSPAGLGTIPFSPESGLFALCTPDQLDTFVEANLTSNYELYADLDFTGINFTDTAVVQGTYEGMFDGRGHTIRNVTINQTAGGPAALFRQTDGDGNFTNDDATIKNLKIENFNLTTNAPSNGALVGNVLSGSQISRVSANGITITITAAGDGTGGLVGKMLANASATNSVNVNNWSSMRGIKVNGVTIINNSTHTDIGGIVGIIQGDTSLENAIVKNVTLRTSNSSQRLGGAIGLSNRNAHVRSIKASGVNLGTSTNPLHASTISVGGLIGRAEEINLVNSKADNVYSRGGNSKIGGLIGEALGGNIQNVVGDIDVVSAPTAGSVGGLIGHASNNATSQGITIAEARSFGSLNCAAVSCGGLIGTLYADSGTTNMVLGSYSEATITSTSNNVGGLIGQANNNAATIQIIESAAFNTISGVTNVGGLVGRANGVDFLDSFAMANITGSGTTNGGFVGNMNAGSFTRCYSKPILAASNANYMPFVNGFTGTPNVIDVFYVHADADTNIDGAGGNQLNLAQSQIPGNFTNFVFNATGPWFSSGTEAPELRVINAFKDLGGFDTGSEVDPILLESPTEWNSIGDKPQLMEKVFRLGNNLDFGFGAFTPIGSSTNPFVGKLQGNNMTISNINFTDTEANAPVGLFRKIGASFDNGATEIEHENPFNYDEDFKLIIRNVHIAKAASQFGAAGILAGSIVDDGSANPMNGQSHDWNGSIKLGNIEIYDSSVDGGKQTTTSPVGGIAGTFTHTNGQSEIRDIRIYDTDISSGNQSAGTGGMFGNVLGPLNPNSTPSFRKFDTFIFDGLTVTATGASAYNVGGAIGSMVTQTADWSMFIINNTNVSGNSSVGGVIGDLFGFTITQGTFRGSVNAAVFGGGIAGQLRNAGLYGFLSEATVNSASQAGCLVGLGSLNPSIMNSIGNCPSVTGSGVSYFGNLVNGAPSPPSIYTGPTDEAIGTGVIYATPADIVDPTFLSSTLISMDPWVFEPGLPPRPFWEVFPEALERN